MPQSLPGRGVGEMHVVEEEDERLPGGELGEHAGNTAQETDLRRIALRRASPCQSRAADQDRYVVEEPLARLRDVSGLPAAQVTLQRLGPHPERRRLTQRMGSGCQGESTGTLAGEELGRQPALPCSG